MSNILVLSGAGVFDTSFTIDPNPSLGIPEISWNVTRIECDAFNGRFGAPKTIAFSELVDWGRPQDEWENLDRQKVEYFMANRDLKVAKPYWKAGGLVRQWYDLLDIPAIIVLLKLPSNIIYTFPVDGNHRIKAREKLGLKTFDRFVVPLELEGNYRISWTEL